jgi:hypothetical protein
MTDNDYGIRVKKGHLTTFNKCVLYLRQAPILRDAVLARMEEVNRDG